MKIIKILSIAFLSTILLSGCGIHYVPINNVNNQVTNVELGEKNFKVVDKISGTTTATYVFGIGGLSKKSLLAMAKTQMLENANLIGNARAIVNLTTEEHITLVYPVYFRRTLTVSGHVVEFTE